MSPPIAVLLLIVALGAFFFGRLVGIDDEKHRREMRKMDKELKRLKG